MCGKKLLPAHVFWGLGLILACVPAGNLVAFDLSSRLEQRPEQRLFDEAGLLSAQDTAIVEASLQSTAREFGKDIYIISGSNNPQANAERFAEFFYRRSFMGDPDRDGLIMVIDMGSRDMYLKTFGKEIKRLEPHVDTILDAIALELKAGNYFPAMSIFIKAAKPVSYGEAVMELVRSPIPYGIGLVLATIVTVVLSFGHKGVITVGKSSYQEPGSFALTRSEDIFLRTTVTRSKRSSSSSGDSSSGGSSGGGGRSF